MTDQARPTLESQYRRTRPKRLWIWLLLVATVLIALFWLISPRVIWDGAVRRPIRITVTDDSDGSPVPRTKVLLMQPREESFARQLDHATMTQILQEGRLLATTDARGQAVVTGTFGAGGTDGFLIHTGNFNLQGRLTVSHENYLVEEGTLQNYFQRQRFPIRQKDLSIRIYLVRKRAEPE